MTPEDVQKMIKDAVDGVKRENDKALETVLKAQEEAAAEVERLRGANSRLLKDLKKAKVKVTTTGDDDGDDDDGDDAPPNNEPKTPAERRLAALEKQLADREAAMKSKAQKAALAEAIAAANVAPHFRDAVAALFSSKKIDVDGDDVLVDGVPVAKAVTDWAKTDSGKVYVSAPASGVPGGKGAVPGSRPAAPSSVGDSGGTTDTKAAIRKQLGGMGKYIREHGLKAWQALPEGSPS